MTEPNQTMLIILISFVAGLYVAMALSNDF